MKQSQSKIEITVATVALMALSSTAAASLVPINNVPEPGPIGLLVLGGVALIIARRIGRNK